MILATEIEFACKTRTREMGLSRLRGIHSGTARSHPLFLAPPYHRKPRVSAAKAMSLADNFLQKQQKQRGRQWANTPLPAMVVGRHATGRDLFLRHQRQAVTPPAPVEHERRLATVKALCRAH